MKRKLNEDGVPEATPPAKESSTSSTFADFGLDFRLLQAISAEQYASPTAVQSLAIPQALEGKNLIVRARTGSGKTAAYILPLLEFILRKAGSTASSSGTSTLILVPTRELASQISKVISKLSTYCSKVVQVINLTGQVHEQSQRALLASEPDIVVATPATALNHLRNSNIAAEKLTNLVVDEADLILSYGYEEDFKSIVRLIPQNIQTFLASATLTPEVDTLKDLLCENAEVLDVQETEEDAKSISQYIVKCAEDEKFLLLFALFKLKLIKGKSIIFVGDVDRCYRVKLFLEQFGTRSCVLNSELPVNCRIHVVEEFNKGVYDMIIATDEHEVVGHEEDQTRKSTSGRNESAEMNDEEVHKSAKNNVNESARKSHHNARKKKDKEYGISRGIDFQHVTCVLNFDLPTSSKSYMHRIGRTARAGRTGVAMSFVVPSQEYLKNKTLSFPTTAKDEAILSKIERGQEKRGQNIQPYNFDMKKLDGFRYRVSSALQAVSAGAIREARIRELRQEMLKSEKLKRHLEENPEDANFLRHDMELKPAKVLPHMKHVPEYLLPSGTIKPRGGEDATSLGGDFVTLKKQTDNSLRNARLKNKMRNRGRAAGRRKVNPLKTFRANA